ncbi:lipopolysaccharide assembly protein LapB [Pelagibius sp.]|uniref:tetratricopeptide repeat protein n=1 Tax=Pelagibius sp. TaxID=1931238 RepID=UPI002619F0F1|nr:tetratricopeptide repeat protein [Pelagibius sp.]
MKMQEALDWALDWVAANPAMTALIATFLLLVLGVAGGILGLFGRPRRRAGRGGGTVQRRSNPRGASAAEGETEAWEDFDPVEIAEQLLSRRGAPLPVDRLVVQLSELRRAVDKLRTWARTGVDRDRTLLALRQLAAGRGEAAETIFREALAQGRNATFEGRLAAAAAARHLGALAVLHDAEAAVAAYEEAVTLDPDHFDGLTNLGEIYMHLDRREDAERVFAQQLRFDEIPSGAGLQRVSALIGLARGAHGRGDLARATELCERAVHLSRDIGQDGHLAYALGNLGVLHFEQGHDDLAEEMLNQALALEQALGNEEAASMVMGYLGTLAKRRGDLEGAGAVFQEMLALARDSGLRDLEAEAYDCLGDLAEADGDRAAAGKHWTAARTIFAERGLNDEVAELDAKLDGLGSSSVQER